MKSFKMFLMVAVALFAAAVLAVAPAGAAGMATQVGGLSLVITLTGTSTSGPADVTWDTPDNFDPDYVVCIDELDGEPNRYEWFRGMANESAILTTGSDGVMAYESEAAGAGGCGFDVDTAGTIVIDAACQTASESYSCWAFRYSQ